MPDNLQDGFSEVGGHIFPVLSDCGYKPRVFRPNIYQHCGLEIYLNASLNVEQCFSQEVYDYIKHCLVAVGKFVYVFEVR